MAGDPTAEPEHKLREEWGTSDEAVAAQARVMAAAGAPAGTID